MGSDDREVITVRTEKIMHNIRKWDGNGMAGEDTITMVSEPEEKVYRVSFHKHKRRDDVGSVPFGCIIDEQSGSGSQSVS